MNYDNIKNALQDLIVRLQDAEAGFEQVAKHTSNVTIKSWASKFGKERHQMHKELEVHMHSLNGTPEVKTSILGDVHRMFINFKFNLIDSDLASTVNEIERGASTLISDYKKVISDVEMTTPILQTVIKQKATVEAELQHVKDLAKAYAKINA